MQISGELGRLLQVYLVLEEKDTEEGNMEILCFYFSKKNVVWYRDIRSYAKKLFPGESLLNRRAL